MFLQHVYYQWRVSHIKEATAWSQDNANEPRGEKTQTKQTKQNNKPNQTKQNYKINKQTTKILPSIDTIPVISARQPLETRVQCWAGKKHVWKKRFCHLIFPEEWKRENRGGKENRNNRLHPRNPLIKSQTVINQWVEIQPLSTHTGEGPYSCPSHDRIYSKTSSRVYL